jgi:WD40 repeat protein
MKKLKTFNKAARSCEYSPDGKYIAIGMADGSAYVVKADTLEDLKIINNRHREISDVRFSPS